MIKAPDPLTQKKQESQKKSIKHKNIIRELLTKANIRFMENKGFLGGVNKETIYVADFYLPKSCKMVISIEQDDNKKLSDVKYYQSRGFRVCSFSESYIEQNKEGLIDKVQALSKLPRGKAWYNYTEQK